MNILNLIKNLFYICIGICFLLLFSTSIENLLGTNNYFSWIWNTNSFWQLDVFIILALLCYTVLKIKNYKTDTPNISHTYIFFFSILFYTYERFFSDYFEFNTFSLFDCPKSRFHIYYLDGFYWIAIFYFAVYLKYLIPKDKDISQSNTLLEDAPIHNKSEDELNGLLDIPTDKIKKIIKDNKFQNSFTIGLNGEWGDGKTSIFNMVKDKLKNEKDCIIVDFNPWMGFDKKVLVKDFFNSLSKPLGTDFMSEFSEYSNEILNNGEENTFIKNLQFIWKKKMRI
ncbi:KAP family P-loop domain protein [Elizabethkingia miricola]|nr:KAP family P-loop domain protein [Elizabethkingia miricola]